jgi:hypothetical protein
LASLLDLGKSASIVLVGLDSFANLEFWSSPGIIPKYAIMPVGVSDEIKAIQV